MTPPTRGQSRCPKWPNQRLGNRNLGFAQLAIRNVSARELTSWPLARSTTCPSQSFSRMTTPVRTWASATTSPLSSQDEWDSCSSSNDSDSDSEDETPTESYTLPQGHEFWEFRPELLRLSQVRLKEFISRVQYDVPPRKRSRMARLQPEPLYLQEEEDPSDTELVVLSSQPKIRRSFHLACPFHAADPEKYKQCLLRYDRQSIEGLIDHLICHHTKPFYCARCSETFGTAIDRDNHILDARCELLDPKPMDGIDQYQKSKLWKRDRWYIDERKRWRRMWTTVFPSQPPRSPYLDQGLGLEVSMARDFWEMYGWQCVSEFLSSRGYPDEPNMDDERAQNALYDLVLKDLLIAIIAGQPTAGGC
ncbi:hypothetical protein LCI18_011036 [Fusarium solani-melongenae]|uniref:Uncharacterized protein n=1 Tax=Fusarium solani subsp. cucurbitae TaxID=2747967 RepID=A0ACD3ZGW9_FUSSC|nr:hypothetical protein LCI18_011036 [Fusarium solani-melongenae]